MHGEMVDIEIKRGYEVLPDNNVRFGIRVINKSDSAISDVEVILDYSASLFEISGNKIQHLGTIPPNVPRTAKFILKPLGCIHKEEINAIVTYKDHQWKKHVEQMRPKEVHCVCPFLKEKSITRADFLRLSNSGSLEERGVNFDGITVDKLVDFIGHICKNRLYKVDEFPIENGKILYLAGDALGEKAYYLLTAVVKEYEGLTQVLLRANSDKSYGLNGFLNEILDNLRHLVLSASAREIGIIKKEQVINIIDSVVQRSTISMGEGASSINIKDSMVQRTEIKGEGKRREEESLREEREEKEKLRRQREEEERAQREDAERRESERQKARQEEERIEKEREKLSVSEKMEGISQIKFLAVALVLGMLLLGYWMLAPSATEAPANMKSTPAPTPKATTITTTKEAAAAISENLVVEAVDGVASNTNILTGLNVTIKVASGGSDIDMSKLILKVKTQNYYYSTTGTPAANTFRVYVVRDPDNGMGAQINTYTGAANPILKAGALVRLDADVSAFGFTSKQSMSIALTPEKGASFNLPITLPPVASGTVAIYP